MPFSLQTYMPTYGGHYKCKVARGQYKCKVARGQYKCKVAMSTKLMCSSYIGSLLHPGAHVGPCNHLLVFEDKPSTTEGRVTALTRQKCSRHECRKVQCKQLGSPLLNVGPDPSRIPSLRVEHHCTAIYHHLPQLVQPTYIRTHIQYVAQL